MPAYNEKLDLAHNIYGLFFCIQMFFLNIVILFNHNNNVLVDSYFRSILNNSLFYFTISTVINYFDKNYIFILHHIICLIFLYYGYFYNEHEYLIFLSKSFMAEISTIFLTLSKILRYCKKNDILIPYKLQSYSDSFFIITYLGIRILYLLPLSLFFILTYSFKSFFYFLVPIITLILISMNLYWTYLIYKKITRNNENIADKKSIKHSKNKK
jgi:hypothetical protein